LVRLDESLFACGEGIVVTRIENAWNTRGKEGVRDGLTVLHQEIYAGLFP